MPAIGRDNPAPRSKDLAMSTIASVAVESAPCREDIRLPSGRTIHHERMGNGAQMATPTTGPEEMTHAEYADYCRILKSAIRRK